MLVTGSVLALVVLVAAIGAAVGAAALPATAVAVLSGVAALCNVLLLAPLVSFVRRDFRFARASSHRAHHVETRVAAGTDRAPEHNRPASVVLISIDTLRADRLGAYGSQRGLSPNLDRLAARGVVCETAIASSSWTLPSVASFLTGLNPSRHGAGPPLNGFDLMARAPLRAGTWTRARGLQAAGYATHAVVSNPYLAMRYGLAAGFDTYENVSIESEALMALRPTVAGKLLAPFLGNHIGDSGAIVTQRALRLLERLTAVDSRATAARPYARAPVPDPRTPTPVFLWLHYIDPHAPYGCSGNKSFRGDTLLSAIRHESSTVGDRFEAIARLRAGEIRLSGTEKRQLVALYDAGVAEVDRQIGMVVDHVREVWSPVLSGERDRSACNSGSRATSTTHDPLIIVVADHGEEFWDHGGVEHGHTFYEELVRVPLIFAGGGLPSGRRVADLVRLIDLPPTVLNLLGLPVPDLLDGVPIATPLASPLCSSWVDSPFASTACDAATSTDHDGPFALCESLLFAEDKLAIRTDRYKYVRWANGKEELYDLMTDAAELRDVAATADLAWAHQFVAEREGAPLEASGSEATQGPSADSAAIHARLQALGYI